MVDDFKVIAEQFLRMVSSELDPYTSQQGQITSDKNSVSLFTPSHIQFAKYGRGPGKQPPLNEILEWVVTSGKIDYGEDPRGTAYAIAHSIGEKGTVNYTPNAPNAMDEAITKYLDQYLEAANESIAVLLMEEMSTTRYLPESIEIFKI